MGENLEAKQAEWGKRMIEIRVRLWTDNIAEGKGQIVPKHAWDAGVVLMGGNSTHGIVAGNPIPFNGFAELPAKMEKALIAHGVKVHLSKRQRRYIVAE